MPIREARALQKTVDHPSSANRNSALSSLPSGTPSRSGCPPTRGMCHIQKEKSIILKGNPLLVDKKSLTRKGKSLLREVKPLFPKGEVLAPPSPDARAKPADRALRAIFGTSRRGLRAASGRPESDGQQVWDMTCCTGLGSFPNVFEGLVLCNIILLQIHPEKHMER